MPKKIKPTISASEHKNLEPKLSKNFLAGMDTFCFGMVIFTEGGQPQNKTSFGRHNQNSMEESVTKMQQERPDILPLFEAFKRLRRFDVGAGLFKESEKKFFDDVDNFNDQYGSSIPLKGSTDSLNDKRSKCLKINREIGNIFEKATREASGVYKKFDDELSEIKEKGKLETDAVRVFYDGQIATEPSDHQKDLLEKEKEGKIAEVAKRLEAAKKQIQENQQQELIKLDEAKKRELDQQFDALWTLKQETDPNTDETFKQDLEQKRLAGYNAIDNIYLGNTLEIKLPAGYIQKKDGDTITIQKPSTVGYKEFMKIEKDGNSHKIKATLETPEDAVTFAEMIIANFKDKGVTITLPEHYEHEGLIIKRLTDAGFSEEDIVIRTKNDKGMVVKEETPLERKIKSTDTERVKEEKIEKSRKEAEKINEGLRTGKQSALRDDEVSAAKTSPVIAPVEQSRNKESDIHLSVGILRLAATKLKDPNGRYREELALIASTPEAADEIQLQLRIDAKVDALINGVNGYATAAAPNGYFNIPFGAHHQTGISFANYSNTIKTLPASLINDHIGDIIHTLTTLKTNIRTPVARFPVGGKGSTVDTVLTQVIANLQKIEQSPGSPEQKKNNVDVQLASLQAAIDASAQSADINHDITDEIKKSPKERSRAIASYQERLDGLRHENQIFETAAVPGKVEQAKTNYFNLLTTHLHNIVSGDYAPKPANLHHVIPDAGVGRGGSINKAKYLLGITSTDPDPDLDVAIRLLTQPISATALCSLNLLNNPVFDNNATTLASLLSISVSGNLINATNHLKDALKAERDLKATLQQPLGTAVHPAGRVPTPDDIAALLEAAKETETAKKELGQAVKMAEQDLEKKQKDLTKDNLTQRQMNFNNIDVDTIHPNAKEIADLLIAANSAPKDQKTIDHISFLLKLPPPPPPGSLNDDPLKRQITDELLKTSAGRKVLEENTELTTDLRTKEEKELREYLDNFRQALRCPTKPPDPNFPTLIDYLYSEAQKKEIKSRLDELDKMLDQPIMKERDVLSIHTTYYQTISSVFLSIAHPDGYFGPPGRQKYYLHPQGISDILAAVHQAVTPQNLKAAIDDNAGGGVPTPRPFHM